jgi:alkenylglycerophosphocholine hydrolase
MKSKSSRRWIAAQIVIAATVALGMSAPYTQLRATWWLLLGAQGLPTTVLLAWVASCPTSESRRYRWGIVVAFVFSQIGGFLLGVPGHFVAGVLGYLGANIAYLTAFTTGVRLARRIFPFAILGLLAAVVLTLAWPRIPDGHRLAVVLYAVTIVSVPAQAITRGLVTRRAGAVAAALGAPLLLISDSAIAIDRFYDSFAGADVFIMSTYFIGQWLIASSVGWDGNDSGQQR